jgi:hypothetical protein
LEPHILTLGVGDAIRLSSQDRIHLRFAHYYRIVEDPELGQRWRVITTGYVYSLDDANLQEILAFHWHPTGRSPVIEPHLHLGPGARVGYDRLHRAHIPTGHITIQEVLLLAINDLGVEPLIDREAALQTLADTRSL